jgi:hypothetical protein
LVLSVGKPENEWDEITPWKIQVMGLELGLEREF